jgi:hypothetical protein
VQPHQCQCLVNRSPPRVLRVSCGLNVEDHIFGDDNGQEDNYLFWGFFWGFWRACEDPLETLFGELRVHWLLGIFTAMKGVY